MVRRATAIELRDFRRRKALDESRIVLARIGLDGMITYYKAATIEEPATAGSDRKCCEAVTDTGLLK